MARREIFDKRTVIEEGAKYVKEKGIEKLNVRELAKFIGCSTQPIYRSYMSMEEYKKELGLELRKYYQSFISKIVDRENYLLTISYAYALFAKKEPNIFRALFITDLAGSRTINQVVNTQRNKDVIEAMKVQYNIDEKMAEGIFRDTRFYTHGIATQLCCESIRLRDEDIYELIEGVIDKFIN